MHVLIAGGTGLIGRALIAHLLPAGHHITVLSRHPEHAQLPDDIQLLRWDGRTPAGWGQAVAESDAVINLAGESIAGAGPIPARWTAQRKQRILQSRLDATRAIVAAISEAPRKPQVLVQGSAVGYYGSRHDDTVLDEDSPPGDDFLAQVARQWEAASEPVRAHGVRLAIARTGLVLSAEGGSLPPLLMQFRYFLGGPLGDGRQWWPWIHIQDEVRALVFLMRTEQAAGPFNLAAPNPVTNRAFAHTLGKIMGRPALLPAPAWALRLALGEMATLLLDGQRAIPRRLLEQGFSFDFPELAPALQVLLQPQ